MLRCYRPCEKGAKGNKEMNKREREKEEMNSPPLEPTTYLNRDILQLAYNYYILLFVFQT